MKKVLAAIMVLAMAVTMAAPHPELPPQQEPPLQFQLLLLPPLAAVLLQAE